MRQQESRGKSRGLITDTESDRISGAESVENSKRYQAVSRIRRRIHDELPRDLKLLKKHKSELYDEFQEVVLETEIKIREEELDELLSGSWGNTALAECLDGDPLSWFAKTPDGKFVQAWPDWGDEPVLKEHRPIVLNQLVENAIGKHSESGKEIKPVSWDESPFPEQPDEWVIK